MSEEPQLSRLTRRQFGGVIAAAAALPFGSAQGRPVDSAFGSAPFDSAQGRPQQGQPDGTPPPQRRLVPEDPPFGTQLEFSLNPTAPRAVPFPMTQVRLLPDSVYHDAQEWNRGYMARLDAGSLEIHKEWQPLEEVLGAVLNRLSRQLQGRRVETRLDSDLPFNCRVVDQPIAALLKDLKQRGLLDTTLVVWGSEFGRTPLGENRPSFGGRISGRDHHPFAFSVWMAGGGVKGGRVIGETDEIGWNIVKDPIHVNDFHATILHLFGLEHTQLTYRFQGRDFRLTDVGGKVVEQLLA